MRFSLLDTSKLDAYTLIGQELMFKIRDLYKYKILISNFSYLSILEVIGLIFPILTYPYLIGILGKDTYGAVVMAQSIAAYLVIIVNFGFNVSATRDISKNRGNSFVLSKIVSAVFLSKFLIFIILAIIYVSIILFTSIISDKLLYLFSLGLCIQEIFFPTWFFQGIEKMKFITLITFVTRMSFVLLIFLCIKSNSDYVFVPLINSMGGLLASIISIFVLRKLFNIKFVSVPTRYLRLVFLRSVPFFFSRFVSVVMEKSNAVLVGSVLSYGDLAVYDLAVKIVGLLRIPFNLIAQVLYPTIVRTKNIVLIKNMLKISIYISLIIIALMFFIVPYVVAFLGNSQLNAAVSLIYVLNTVLPIVAVSSILGATTLVTFGKIKEYNLSVIYSFIIYLLVIAGLFLFNKLTLLGVAVAYILPEYGVGMYRYWISKKYIF